ncbi:acetyltransferase [Vibrio aestuarianus]|uniref:acetyltransferase n=1 Tax=Vibrio aestuarianus TaxID=28171 RepID=UPI0021C2995E|nr:acetyltransferase [Vibrio aestuarianus]MDE1326638.1 acetyltransferase [Vibrio aestuarianus]CAH8239389.1 Acetyltransferase [Vibrio aestuarianus]
MKYGLYKQEQTQEIITLFNDTFSDSEGKEEGAVIAKLVEDFLTFPPKDEDFYMFIAQSLVGEAIPHVAGKPICLLAIDNPYYW